MEVTLEDGRGATQSRANLATLWQEHTGHVIPTGPLSTQLRKLDRITSWFRSDKSCEIDYKVILRKKLRVKRGIPALTATSMDRAPVCGPEVMDIIHCISLPILDSQLR